MPQDPAQDPAQNEKAEATISIPADVDFSDLKLERNEQGRLRFDLDVIERVCKESNLPIETITEGPETNLAGILVTWYQVHRQRGGAPDPVMDELLGGA